jgi:biotin synthase-like enzyme
LLFTFVDLLTCCFCYQSAALYLQQKNPSKALEIVDELLKELRKLDDKQMLTEVHLTESRVYHSLQNVPKGELCAVHLFLCIHYAMCVSIFSKSQSHSI